MKAFNPIPRVPAYYCTDCDTYIGIGDTAIDHQTRTGHDGCRAATPRDRGVALDFHRDHRHLRYVTVRGMRPAWAWLGDDQEQIARFLLAHYDNGVYVARQRMAEALGASLPYRPRAFRTSTYTELRDYAIGEIEVDPLIAARVALRLTKHDMNPEPR